MKKNEEYWLNLYNDGKIKIDFENGLVFSYLTKKEHLLNCRHSSGYLQASAGETRKKRNYILLHRLIWIVYFGEIPKNMQINHKNGIKSDNRLSNLEICTKSENAKHSIRILGNKTGCLRGEKHPFAKIKQKDVDEMKRLFHQEGISVKKLEKMYNIKQSQIYAIISGRSWKDGANHSCRVVGNNEGVE